MAELLTDLTLKSGYATGYDHLIDDFYSPCLNVAAAYDRGVGYFRSTLYVLMGLAFSGFVLRGGKMRLVCSPELTAEDIDAISQGYDDREVIRDRMDQHVKDLLSSPDDRPVAEFLATLIAFRALEIRLAFRTTARGIYHDKLGIFRDVNGHVVSFVGSINETFSAWDPGSNHESFEVFASWRDSDQGERTRRHVSSFEKLWRNQAPGITTRDFPSAVAEKLIKIANPLGIDPAAEGVRRRVGASNKPKEIRDRPAVPSRRQLQPHQQGVIEDWISNGHHGIIDHVTGAGKTVTALRAIEYWLRRDGSAIVLVPSELLWDQWRHEIESDLADLSPEVLLVGGGVSRKSWEPMLPDFTRGIRELGPRIVLATMQTAATQGFRSRVIGGPHLMVVGDEVHRLGSAAALRIFELTKGGALGLSATPDRFGDPEGSAAIRAFFGRVLNPRFGIPDAIAAGRLVPYDYYVHECALSVEEQARWDEITVRIGKFYVRLPKDGAGNRVHTEQFLHLLIQRASILKHAESKVAAAAALIGANYREGQRWLAYCDTKEQLSQLVLRLRDLGLPTDEYHSAMAGSRAETFQYFSKIGGILVAIKCLDEGVDIPVVDRAIILASSTNSREFIQRRGRVLRTAPDKHSAEIHDLLVVPSRADDGSVDQSRSAILRSELRRAAEFARHARNAGTMLELEVLARQEGGDEFLAVTEEYEEQNNG